MQFAVLYEARANTGIDRAKIIGAVAKSVPPPHKVDLGSPNLTIVVQIVKVRKTFFPRFKPVHLYIFSSKPPKKYDKLLRSLEFGTF